MQENDNSVTLRLRADAAWIPLVQGVVEQGAPVLGLERDKTLRLVMATEELVAHLAETSPGTEITMTLEPCGWNVRADFAFRADPSDLWAMNIVSRADLTTEGGMQNLGLLLASRMVDGFTLRVENRVVHLRLQQDRSYPAAKTEQVQRFRAKGALTIAENPEAALVKEACVKALNLYPAQKVHQAFATPGKVVDMIAAGYLNVAVAQDETGATAGLICWHAASSKAVSFFGPYVFVEDDDAGEVLTEHLIHGVARSRAVGLFSDLATRDLPTHEFEPLGSVAFSQADGDSSTLDIWYRHLREDMGAAVWAHETMIDWLESTYDELVLMREIRAADMQGEALPGRSVLSAKLRPELSEVWLSPLVVGADAEACVADHVETLRQEDYRNIFFRLDLAYGWQAALGGALARCGFVPKFVLPYGGDSDVVVFQHG